MLRETKIVRWAELKPILGLSRMTIYRLESAGEFPKRIQLGSGNSVGWLEHEVEQWLADRIANRIEDDGAPAQPDDGHSKQVMQRMVDCVNSGYPYKMNHDYRKGC